MTETQLKTKVLKYLKETYPTAFCWKISDRWISGIPDIYFLKDGISYWFELKVGKNKATKIQEYVINKINEAGGTAMVIRSLDEIKEVLK